MKLFLLILRLEKYEFIIIEVYFYICLSFLFIIFVKLIRLFIVIFIGLDIMIYFYNLMYSKYIFYKQELVIGSIYHQ